MLVLSCTMLQGVILQQRIVLQQRRRGIFCNCPSHTAKCHSR